MPKFLSDFFQKKGKKGVQGIVLMLIVGVALLMISTYLGGRGDDGGVNAASPSMLPTYHQNQEQIPATVAASASMYLAERLEEILSLVAGAGRVRVMLTIGAGSAEFAQNNQQITSTTLEEDGEGGIRNVESINSSITYVMIRQSDGSESPLLLAQTLPAIEGVVIVAEGAADIAVRAALTHAVQALLGVAAHRVQVLQMQ